MSNHDVIIEEVRAALARDPRIAHAAEVAVAERQGRVTLRGTVRSIHQRRAAVEIAKALPGVRTVDDGLRIDCRDHTRDNEIRGAALQALSDDGVPARVHVDVANGWVTLKGRGQAPAQERCRVRGGLGDRRSGRDNEPDHRRQPGADR
jgi:osmotically-inducible protein OsmY